ncbi:unnamed protein product [Blepharisma stoltei]|uniref:PA domain-containing protein n=1 Tax=Blepharisma stoltei TaxID=1481888 RepID=A0AAU9IBH3_9CILI|nr:unnamed protein product [Blepharisma stoltei]
MVLFRVFSLLITFSVFISADITIYRPRTLKDSIVQRYDKNSIPISIANFGNPPYGRKIIGKVYLPNEGERLGCLPFTNLTVHQPEEFQASFLIVEIGRCPNTLKVKHAQEIGVNCVIIANSMDGDINEHVLSDDGVGTDVNIPSALITKSDGHDIINEIISGEIVEIGLEFSMRKSYLHVELGLWMSSDNLKILDFVSELYDTINEVDFSLVTFSPNYVHWRCSVCADNNFTSPVDNCLSGGRYCAADPDGLGPLTGKSIVAEDLRQKCLWMTSEAKGSHKVWFKYMSLFRKRCISSFTEECSKKIINEIGMDYKDIDKCIKDSTEGGKNVTMDDNSILRQERRKWKHSGVQFYPAIVINNQTYMGNWDSKDVLDAICSAFEETPQSCFDNGYGSDWPENQYMVSMTTLIMILLGFFCLLIFALLYYRLRARSQMKQEMRRQINQAVTQYFALQDINTS